MRISDFRRHAALSFFVTGTILVGCGGKQTVPSEEPVTLRPTIQTSLSDRAPGRDLLYIANRNSEVIYVDSYPQGARLHTIERHQIALLYNVCSDSSGHVYVLNYFGSSEAEILVYAHGRIHSMRKIYPIGDVITDCSSDPTTGNLAVVGYYPPVQIVFPHAMAPGTGYSYPNNFSPSANSYDDKGNLFVAGSYASSAYASLLELQKGSSTFVNITMPSIRTHNGGGIVRWDGKNLALGNGAASIYRLAIHGTNARTVGVTHLKRSSHVIDFWIQGDTIVGSNYGKPTVMIWNYPGGGLPTKVLHRVGKEDAVTVSVPPSH